MHSLLMEGTSETPTVRLDKARGIFEITGRSFPEDSMDFYKPVIDWLLGYMTDPNPTTEFVVKMDYLNTSSSKLLQDLFHTLEMIKGSKVIWYYPSEDEDMEELGKEYAERAEIPFEFRVY